MTLGAAERDIERKKTEHKRTNKKKSSKKNKYKHHVCLFGTSGGMV